MSPPRRGYPFSVSPKKSDERKITQAKNGRGYFSVGRNLILILFNLINYRGNIRLNVFLGNSSNLE